MAECGITTVSALHLVLFYQSSDTKEVEEAGGILYRDSSGRSAKLCRQ